MLLGAKSKRPDGKHWHLTSDAAEIEAHLRHGANAGIVAGPSPNYSGLAFLDPDDMEAWKHLVSLLDEPGRPWVRTGSGKLHYYILWEPELPAKIRFAGKIIGEIQRGPTEEGKPSSQQVVAPPSVHPDGGAYQWLVDPLTEPLRPLPEVWRRYLRGEFSTSNGNGHRADVEALRARALEQPGAKERAGGIKFQCPECRGEGHDQHQDNAKLFIDGRWGCAIGGRSHWDAIGRELGAFTQTSGQPREWVTQRSESEIHCTDLGNARRLVHIHGERIRFVSPWNKWLIWDGRRWRQDETREIELLAKDVPRRLLADAQFTEDSDTRAKLAKWAIATESRQRIDAAIHLARSEPGIPVLPRELDTDPWALNLENGTIDLRTGELRPHRRDDLITKLCPVRFDVGAECPRFLRFLSEIMLERESLVDYLRRAMGYAGTGSTREQVLFFPHGDGSNGKSTLLGIVRDTLGPDYAMEALPELLLTKKGETHPTERADLHGKRFVSTIEVQEGRHLAEALVKHLTGDTSIRARRLYQDSWEFTPTHTLFLAANHKPVIQGTDYAMWRRVRLIPFEATFDDDTADRDLPEKLALEKPGILAWLVAGAMEWYRDGLRDPPEVLAATEDYRREMDVFGEFLADKCITGDDSYTVRSAELYESYTKWLRGEPMTRTAFGKELTKRGMSQGKTSHGDRFWRGIALRTPRTEEK